MPVPIDKEQVALGYDVGLGWVPLVEELNSILVGLYPDYKIDQIKEKLGGLRYYVSDVGQDAYDLIDEYEKKSYTICEKCGRPGELRKEKFQLRTLCDEHNAER